MKDISGAYKLFKGVMQHIRRVLSISEGVYRILEGVNWIQKGTLKILEAVNWILYFWGMYYVLHSIILCMTLCIE